jgi:type IV pilus assembly protein PilX
MKPQRSLLRQSRHALRAGQRGMTLLVGLILLMMLTMVGTIGFRNTTLSERMTGNTFDRNLSFQAAESYGKEAVTLILSPGGVTGLTAGYYATPLARGGSDDFWTKGDGATVSAGACATTTPFSWTSCAATRTTSYSNGVGAQGVIELLKTESSGGSTTLSYRITTRSRGGSGNAEVVLQSQYVRVTTP